MSAPFRTVPRPKKTGQPSQRQLPAHRPIIPPPVRTGTHLPHPPARHRHRQHQSVWNPLLGPQSPAQSYQSATNSIDTNPINGANLIGTANTVYGIVTDNRAIMFAAKHTWDPFKLFAGYEYIRQANPSNPLGVGALD